MEHFVGTEVQATIRTNTANYVGVRMSTAVWESCLLHFAHYVPVQLTAVYLRVSGANTQKFDGQEDELKRWAELHKPQIIKWYRDKFTGNTTDRPGMQKLMLDLQEGKLKSIVCWRGDWTVLEEMQPD